VLSGAVRDCITHQRRPFVRLFEEALSHEPPDAPLANAVGASGGAVFPRRGHCWGVD
jgi:hypothetical protein